MNLSRLAPFIAAAALLIILPFLFPSRTALTLLCAVGANAVFALSYNLLLGETGMLSFGHAVYYAFGAYASIHVMAAIGAHHWPVPVFLVPLVGFAGGLLAGIIVGLPACRRAGTPFAMITLGLGELFAAAAFMLPSLFGGEEGIAGNRTAGLHPLGFSLGPLGNVYWFIAFWLFVSAVILWAFTRTPLGRLANAARDNADRLQFIGYDPNRVRFIVFALASGMAGLAGGMSAVNFEIVTPSTFSAVNSGLVLMMAYIGGIGVFVGPIVGAVIITFMQSMLADYSPASLFYVGILFMAVVLAAPRGLTGLALTLRAHAAGHSWPLLARYWAARLLSFLIVALGAVILIELAFRVQDSDAPPLALFGLPLSPDNSHGWLIGLCLIGLGWAASRATLRLAPAPTRLEAAP